MITTQFVCKEMSSYILSSVNNAIATVSIGKITAPILAVDNVVQQNIGIFIESYLGARILRIVAIKFTDVKVVPT